MKKEKYLKEQNQGGYTIIETMIAISLFLVVVMTGMTSLLNASAVHQKSQDMRSILDSTSFIMEDMSRNIRTGSKIHCIIGNDDFTGLSVPKSSPSGGNCWGIAFKPSNGNINNPNDLWVYYISNGEIWKSTQGPYTTNANFVKISPDEASISSISGFTVLGALPPNPDLSGDNQQPLVLIRLVGTITYKSVITSFSLQTSVSQRLVDI